MLIYVSTRRNWGRWKFAKKKFLTIRELNYNSLNLTRLKLLQP